MKFLGPTRYNNASFPSIDFSFLGERSRVSTSNYLVYTSEFVYNGVNNEERRKRCEGLRGIPSWKGQSLGTRVLNNFLVCRVSTIVAVVYCLASHSESVTPFPLTRRLRPPPPPTFSSRGWFNFTLCVTSRSITFVRRSHLPPRGKDAARSNDVCQRVTRPGWGRAPRWARPCVCAQSWP